MLAREASRRSRAPVRAAPNLTVSRPRDDLIKGVRPDSVSSISSTRQRHILGVLLAAFAVLSLVSLVSYSAPLPYQSPWSAPNACGPVGALLAFGLIWGVGRVAAFGTPVLSGAWGWNRFRGNPGSPLAVRTALGALLAFEVCTLLGLGGLDRMLWVGGWGLAASLALHAALGSVGSWVVAGAVMGVTVLAASEFAFPWMASVARLLFVAPFTAIAAAFAAWRD